MPVVGGIEIDSWASETFAHNHKEALVIKRDIQLVSDDELRDLFASRRPDILLGGPPCQGFSVCRKNAGDPTEPRNSLFVEFLRVARALQPDYVIMENVPNIEKARTQNGESVIGIIERELKNWAIMWRTAFLKQPTLAFRKLGNGCLLSRPFTNWKTRFRPQRIAFEAVWVICLAVRWSVARLCGKRFLICPNWKPAREAIFRITHKRRKTIISACSERQRTTLESYGDAPFETHD